CAIAVARSHAVLRRAKLVGIGLVAPGFPRGGFGRLGLGLGRGGRRRQFGQGRGSREAERGGMQEERQHLRERHDGVPSTRAVLLAAATLASALRRAGILPAAMSSYQSSWCSLAQVSSTSPWRIAWYAPCMPRVPM